ncbi:MAG: hypothetical protein U1F50_10195 [Rubrivivax sp.]
MIRATSALAAAALAAAAATLPAQAASSASSAISDSLSTSVESISNSLRRSSHSSSGDDKVADGDYRIVEVAAVADQPDRRRLVLEPVAGSGEGFTLDVAQALLAQTGLEAGKVISARNRPYGIEFALAPTKEVFLLALQDAWLRELPTRPVTL